MKTIKIPEGLGYDKLRPGQDKIVEAVLAGEDILGLLPTGGGKSATYIIPSVIRGSSCLVVSPLISLQCDQTDKLRQKNLKAEVLNSTVKQAERARILSRWDAGDVQFLLMAPETLEVMADRMPPKMLVIDEAHTLAQWGTEFRPGFANVGTYVQRCRGSGMQVLALTATLTPDDEDTLTSQFGLSGLRKIAFLPRRENLIFTSSTVHSRHAQVSEILRLINLSRTGACIVYCMTVAGVNELVADLRRNGIDAEPYTGRMPAADKNRITRDFVSGKTNVVVATCAFGMGIDRKDVRLVIHTDVPRSLDAYTQESGRAGRDGLLANCVIVGIASELGDKARFFNDSAVVGEGTLRKVLSHFRRYNGKTARVTADILSRETGIPSAAAAAALTFLVNRGYLERAAPSSEDRIKINSKYAGKEPGRKALELAEFLLKRISGKLDEWCPLNILDVRRDYKVSQTTLDMLMHALDVAGMLEFSPADRVGGYRLKVANLRREDLDTNEARVVAYSRGLRVMLEFNNAKPEARQDIMEQWFKGQEENDDRRGSKGGLAKG